MANDLYNLVRENTLTTGTGTFHLDGALTGYRSVMDAEGIKNNARVTYELIDGNSRELGRGRYNSSASTISRDYVYSSTLGNRQKLNLSGSAQMALTLSAADVPTIIDVRKFGADEDVADNGPYITEAFDEIRTYASDINRAYEIRLPNDLKFPVETTIDATDIAQVMWAISGPGTLVGRTAGTPVLDMTASRYGEVARFLIYGDPAARPSVGLLLARKSTMAVSDLIILNSMYIWGEFTSAALYNFGSEDMNADVVKAHNAYDHADAYCAVFTGENSLGITSPYQTILANTATSFNDVYCKHGDFRRGGAGRDGIFIERATGLSLPSSYGNADGAMFVINKHFGDCNILDLDFHSEGNSSDHLDYVLKFTGAASHSHTGITLRDYSPQATDAICAADTGVSVTLNNPDFWIGAFQPGLEPSNKIFKDISDFTVAQGGKCFLADDTYFNEPTGATWDVVTDSRNTKRMKTIGFTSPITITGSRGANAALADLLTKGASLGLWTDSTS